VKVTWREKSRAERNGVKVNSRGEWDEGYFAWKVACPLVGRGEGGRIG